VKADAAEPVSGVPAVGFLAVDDGVPVAAFGRGQVLGDRVGAVPFAEAEPEPGERGFGMAAAGNQTDCRAAASSAENLGRVCAADKAHRSWAAEEAADWLGIGGGIHQRYLTAGPCRI